MWHEGEPRIVDAALRGNGFKMNTYISGKVIFVNLEKEFFFIQGQVADGTYRKFFAHFTRITRSDVDPKDLKVGMFARFIPSSVPPKKAGDAPYVATVEIYHQDPNLAAASDILAGKVTS
jgi:hypothetical protein